MSTAQASWDVALWWDGKVPDMCYQNNETSLLVLSADTISVDDDFLTNWKFLVVLIRWWIKTRWKGHGLKKLSDGLYTHQDRLVIPRLAQDLCILLLTECHIMLAMKLANACLQLCETFSGRNFCILLVWKLYPPIVMVATVQPDLARFFFLVSLGVTDFPWEIVGMDVIIE